MGLNFIRLGLPEQAAHTIQTTPRQNQESIHDPAARFRAQASRRVERRGLIEFTQSEPYLRAERFVVRRRQQQVGLCSPRLDPAAPLRVFRLVPYGIPVGIAECRWTTNWGALA
jgi:hypothetical protein